MSNRRRQNAINMVSVGGVNIEGVQNIRRQFLIIFPLTLKQFGRGGLVLRAFMFANYLLLKPVI
jgi:hypothetical protein